MKEAKSLLVEDYLPADKYVVLNDNDPDLVPVVLKLPKPPYYSKIDGFGLPYEEQRFKRVEYPRRLLLLEEEALNSLQEEYKSDKVRVVTNYKIQKRFWALLEERKNQFNTEINFIKRMWWHRMHGYWFFNRGKPTYITGWHFMYLNFWKMDTDNGISQPDYRDRDRKEFLFKQYAYTTDETFARVDENGYAIPEPNGRYKMRKINRRLCYGTIQPKNRRSGNTNKAMAIGMEIVTRTIGTDGFGFMSYNGDHSEEQFRTKLHPSYNNLPIIFKPLTITSKSSNEIKFDVAKTDYNGEGLYTKVTYATTMEPGFYDGKKLIFALLDEEGKVSVDTLKRWDIIKNCLSQCNGVLIHGYSEHPSTVDEMTSGSASYRHLCETSKFYRRVPSSGQTFSGLLRLFVPASEGLDGFIDSYGFSVRGEIKDYQRAEGFVQTADQYLLGERDALLKDGSVTAMAKYRELRKLFPLNYADSFLGESGDIGFDMEIIDRRMAELRRENNVRKGNLEWKNKVYGGEVYWIDDEVNGKWLMSQFPPENTTNKKVIASYYSTFDGSYVPMYKPANPGFFTVGADPFRFSNKQEANMKLQKTGSSSRLSDGGISVLFNYQDSVDKGKKIDDWDSYIFVMSYRYRVRNTEEYNEDVLKTAIYWGAMVYPETNEPTTYEYFIRNKFGGYLLYDVDILTGKLKEKPGVHNLEGSKMTLFNLLRDYIAGRGHKENFYPFLQECKDIRGMEEMRSYDRLAAHGLALMGAKSQYADLMKGSDETYDFEDYVETY